MRMVIAIAVVALLAAQSVSVFYRTKANGDLCEIVEASEEV